MELFIACAALVLVALATLVGVWWKSRRRTLSSTARTHIRAAWQRALQLPDPVRQVLEADAVLDFALKEWGYDGSLGEKLKKAHARFTNLDAVWNAHKLRNVLAHEAGATLRPQDAQRAMRSFERALKDLGM